MSSTLKLTKVKIYLKTLKALTKCSHIIQDFHEFGGSGTHIFTMFKGNWTHILTKYKLTFYQPNQTSLIYFSCLPKDLPIFYKNVKQFDEQQN